MANLEALKTEIEKLIAVPIWYRSGPRVQARSRPGSPVLGVSLTSQRLYADQVPVIILWEEARAAKGLIAIAHHHSTYYDLFYRCVRWVPSTEAALSQVACAGLDGLWISVTDRYVRPVTPGEETNQKGASDV